MDVIADELKTKEHLIKELKDLRQLLADIEQSEVRYTKLVGEIKSLPKIPPKKPSSVLRLPEDGLVFFGNQNGRWLVRDWSTKMVDINPHSPVWPLFDSYVQSPFAPKNPPSILPSLPHSIDAGGSAIKAVFSPLEVPQQALISSHSRPINREQTAIATDKSATQEISLEKTIPKDDKKTMLGMIGIRSDIAASRLEQEHIRKLNRTLTALSEINEACLHTSTVSELFEKICRIVVETGGFRTAWIGQVDSEEKHVKPVAQAGVEHGYLEKLNIVMTDEPLQRGPTAIALTTGKHVIIKDLQNDSRMVPWREDALQAGFNAVAIFPIQINGKAQASFTLYTTVTDHFDDEQLMLLEKMTASIAYAVKFIKVEMQRKQAELALLDQVKIIQKQQLLQSTFDAFLAHTVILESDGTIIAVNHHWNRFAAENNASNQAHFLGTNYLTVCDSATGQDSQESRFTADNIRAVINGSQKDFYLEYACHTPSKKYWYAMQVTPLSEITPRRVMIAHIEITERKQTEELVEKAQNLIEPQPVKISIQSEPFNQPVKVVTNHNVESTPLPPTDSISYKRVIKRIENYFKKLFFFSSTKLLPKE